jgi:hypothetical protein
LCGDSDLAGAVTLKSLGIWFQCSGEGNPRSWEYVVQIVEQESPRRFFK